MAKTARLIQTRDSHSGNPITQLHMPDGEVYTFPGLYAQDRAEALIDQLGFKMMWKNWKLVDGGCPHGDCHKHEIRRRIVKK